MSKEALAYHLLNLELGSNYKKLSHLKKTEGSWEKALERQGSVKAFSLEKEEQKLLDLHIAIILETDVRYPRLLKEIPFPPLALYVLGDLPREEELLLACVGTRKATPLGKKLATDLSYELALSGVVIVSGLAFGIDAAAHEGALKAEGKTLAVLASGVNTPYPAHHRPLAQKIVEQGGALISEYPPNSPALPYRLLERNRLVSGLSRGVVIVEAPLRSGSLATARFAIEQNRDVFVFPGPATHPNYAGSHKFIKEGAILITEAADVKTAYSLDSKKETVVSEEFSSEEKEVVKILAEAPKALEVEDLFEMTGYDIPLLNQTMTLLSLKNVVQETASGFIVIRHHSTKKE